MRISSKRRSVSTKTRNQVWNCYPNDPTFEIGICSVCEKLTPKWSHHCSHIISVYNGGTDSINNLVPACIPCNQSMATGNLINYKLDNYPEKIKYLDHLIQKRIAFLQRLGIEITSENVMPTHNEYIILEKNIYGKQVYRLIHDDDYSDDDSNDVILMMYSNDDDSDDDDSNDDDSNDDDSNDDDSDNDDSNDDDSDDDSNDDSNDDYSDDDYSNDDDNTLPVNINTATSTDLREIHGIGIQRSKIIKELRPYYSKNDIKQLKPYIGKKAIKELIENTYI